MENEVSTNVRKNYCFSKKQLYIGAGVVLFLLIAMWTWKVIAMNQQQKHYLAEQEAIQKKAVDLLERSTEQSLKLLSKPYSQAMQDKLFRSDYDGIDIFNNGMIRLPNMIEVMVVNDKGVIEVSTNKKNEKKNFLKTTTSYYINTDSTIVEKQNDSSFLMASPIMGINNRLGTLVVRYAVKIPREWH